MNRLLPPPPESSSKKVTALRPATALVQVLVSKRQQFGTVSQRSPFRSQQLRRTPDGSDFFFFSWLLAVFSGSLEAAPAIPLPVSTEIKYIPPFNTSFLTPL